MQLINSNQFEYVNAKTLSYLSFLAYQDEKTFREALPSHEVHFIESKETDTQCFVVIDNENIVVVFRGTEGSKIKDWATDLDIEFDGDGIHSGFNKAYDSIGPVLYSLTEGIEDKNLFLTGHFLGAALANICYWDCEHSQSNISLYTFGSPRVCNNDLATFIDNKHHSKCYRIVNNNDVVTRVPPRFSGYSHFGTLVYIDTGKNIIEDKDLTWWDLFWDRVAGRVEDFFELGTDGVKDHSISEYWKAFK